MNIPDEIPDPEYYKNVGEYITDRLQVADRPLSPSALADEYECGNVHARKTLSKLADTGDVERVSRGQYVAADNSRRTTGDTLQLQADNTNDEATTDQRETTQSRKSTAELYQRQYNQYNQSGDDTNVEVTTDQQATSMPRLPMEPKTLLVLIVIVLVLWASYRRMSGSGSGSESNSQEDQPNTQQTESDSSADTQGGLIQ